MIFLVHIFYIISMVICFDLSKMSVIVSFCCYVVGNEEKCQMINVLRL